MDNAFGRRALRDSEKWHPYHINHKINLPSAGREGLYVELRYLSVYFVIHDPRLEQLCRAQLRRQPARYKMPPTPAADPHSATGSWPVAQPIVVGGGPAQAQRAVIELWI